MRTPPIELVRRPEARTESVEDLVSAVLRGEVRIPVFQRGLEWQTRHVLELFDSLYRGFPIGSLLLRRAPATAGPMHIGPVAVFGTETRNALWVIDGQQRLTSMVAGLGRPKTLPTTPDDPFVVYFDPAVQQFHAPPRSGDLPDTWVPVPQLLDGAVLTEWVFAWDHGRDDELRRLVFEAGRRLREYRVPLYVIESDDEDAVRAIFHRVNTAGKPLSWTSVHDALYGHKSGPPSTLPALASQLEDLGMGTLDEETQLLPCLVAMRGLDVTRPLGEHLQRDSTVLDGATADAVPVLRRVLGFLRVEAEIPHLRLLPNSAPLVVLARLFTLHPEPNERVTTLLVRWVWRWFLSRDVDERTLERRGVEGIDDDLEASVQRLLELVRHDSPTNFATVAAFDARAAQSRLALLGMASRKPRRLGPPAMSDMNEIDVAELIRQADLAAFRPLVPLSGGFTSSPANRLLLPGSGAAFEELRSFIRAYGVDHPVLTSHLIRPPAARAILDDDLGAALVDRESTLMGEVDRLGERLAEWRRSDRPSLDYLLAQAAGE
ncbi:MAG TPA: DUF262 domain-containing protein [Kofleriaceae bacterium]|jgi:hypothetical protein|nr:DUF262 domain-containing protein [Kofleriaceae bacterium]